MPDDEPMMMPEPNPDEKSFIDVVKDHLNQICDSVGIPYSMIERDPAKVVAEEWRRKHEPNPN